MEKLSEVDNVWIIDYPIIISNKRPPKSLMENIERQMSMVRELYQPHHIINGKVYIKGEPYNIECPFKK